jgi:hypothetical protein
MVWRDFFKYFWTVIERQLCLFAKSADGLFMPLPPIGKSITESAVLRCFQLMDTINSNRAVSRIEDLDAQHIPFFEKMGFTIKLKEQEYLYSREQLVGMAGDEYKSKRWAYNRFVRDMAVKKIRMESYRLSDQNDCKELHTRWKERRGLKHINGTDRRTMDRQTDLLLMEDASSAHGRVFKDFMAMGLTGRIVRLDGNIAAYTFGYPLKPDTFCILLEVADLEMTGLATYLFREFCREMTEYRTIHAMGDSGLERLRKAKLSYRPSQILTSYIATRRAG